MKPAGQSPARPRTPDPAGNGDPDAQAMLRLKAGDDFALNALMERWQHPLASFILRYTGNEQDALDLTQEAFLRVFEHRESYEPRGKFSTWLFTIAANLCRNQARWREHHPTVTMEAEEGAPSLADTVPAPGDTPAANAERDDLADAVREHIRALPHELKTAVLLFEYHDLGYGEIAAALGCTRKAVETRLHRAREILRASLSRWKEQ